MRERDQPVLQATPQLTLRPWTEEDAPAVLAAFADPEIRFWHMREVATEEEARSWIAAWRERWSAETDGSWAIAAVGTDEVVGQVALRTVGLEVGYGQITYWVLPASRGNGVATQAVAALSRWSLEELGLHRLEIWHSVANARSCRVAENVGYALEATMRSALQHEDGWHDMHVHGLVAGDALEALGSD